MYSTRHGTGIGDGGTAEWDRAAHKCLAARTTTGGLRGLVLPAPCVAGCGGRGRHTESGKTVGGGAHVVAQAATPILSDGAFGIVTTFLAGTPRRLCFPTRGRHGGEQVPRHRQTWCSYDSSMYGGVRQSGRNVRTKTSAAERRTNEGGGKSLRFEPCSRHDGAPRVSVRP